METTFNLTDLASLPEKALLDEPTVAKTFNVSTRTIKRWVIRGDLPAPATLGGKKFWFAGKLVGHIEQLVARSETLTSHRRAAVSRAETP